MISFTQTRLGLFQVGKGGIMERSWLYNKMKASGAPGLLLSIDVEKAFDRVDWGFMQSTLEEIGLGPKMTNWIKALYNRPTARVKVNGAVSGSFEMYNGTRQRCPLSPLLFVLAMEPLLEGIRWTPYIRGIKVGEEDHKLAAYADNILFFITSPRITRRSQKP